MGKEVMSMSDELRGNNLAASAPSTPGPPLRLAWNRMGACGLWTWFAWMFFLSHSIAGSSLPWAASGLYLVLSVFLLSAAIVFGSFEVKPKAHRILGYAMAVAGVLSMAALLLSGFCTDGGGFVVVTLVLGSASLAWGYLSWMGFFSKLDARTAIGYVFGACIIASVVKIILAFLPQVVGCIVCTAFPFLSLFFLSKASSLIPNTKNPVIIYSTAVDFKNLWTMVLCVIIYSFICSVLTSSFRFLLPTGNVFSLLGLGRILEIAICAILIWYVFAKNGTLGFVQLWGIITVLIVATVCLTALGVSPIVGYTLMGVAIDVLVAYYWLAIADITHHSTFNTYFLFGVAWCFYAIPRFVGNLPSLTQFHSHPAFAVVILTVVSLTSAVCLSTRNPYIQRIFSDLDDVYQKPEDYAIIDERCAALGREYHLTDREVEVMQMICKGRTKAYIADSLYVTESTVKGHARRLYVKLGVHSKQELQQMIGL